MKKLLVVLLLLLAIVAALFALPAIDAEASPLPDFGRDLVSEPFEGPTLAMLEAPAMETGATLHAAVALERPTFAAKTWTQTSGNLWSTGANWSGGTVPQSGDTVTFDNTSVANCTVDNIGTFNGTITVASTYSGTITQSTAVSGVSTIAINGGIWDCAGFSLSTSDATVTVAAGKQLKMGSNNSLSMSTGATERLLTVAGTLTWSGSLTITGGLSVSSGATVTASSSPTLLLTHGLGFNSGATLTNSVSSITFNGSGLSGTFTDTGDKFSATTFTINKTGAANLTVAASTTCRLGTNPTSTLGTGTLTVTGTLTYSGTWTHTGNITVSATTGTVTGSSSPALTINGSLTINTTSTWTSVNVLVNGSSNTCTYTDTAAKNTGTWTITRSGTVAVNLAASTTMDLGSNPISTVVASTFTNNGTVTYSGNWTHTGSYTPAAGSTTTGSSTPTLNIAGNLSISATATWTSVPITFSGAFNATYTDTAAKNSATITVNNTAGFSVAASTTCPLGSNPTTSVTTGTLTVNGTLTYSGTWQHTGNLVTATNSTVTGSSSPTLRIDGNLTIGSLASGWTSVDVLVNGSTNACTYTDTAGKNTGIWTITRSATATFTIAASTVCNLGTNPTSTVTTGNSFVVNGTVQWAGNWNLTGTISSGAASVFTGTSTPTLTITNSLTINATATITNPIGTVTLGSTSTATYTDTGDKLSGSTIVIGNGGAKNTTIAASTTARLGTNPTSNFSTGTLTVTGTVTYSGTWTVTGGITVSATTGTVTGSSTPSLSITGSLNINATAAGWTSVNITANGSASSTVYTDTAAKNSGTWTINKGGSTSFTVSASTACDLGSNPTTVTGGQITMSGTVTWSGTWSHTGSIGVSGTPTYTGTSTPILSVTDGALNLTGATITNTIGLIGNITSSTSRSFILGGKTFSTFTRTGSGTGAISIFGANTFTTVQDNAGLSAHTLQFEAGVTNTAANWLLAGASGAVLTVNSSSNGVAATLHMSGTTNINAAWLSVKDITVDTTPEWFAGDKSTNVSGNTGWQFRINPRLRKGAGF